MTYLVGRQDVALARVLAGPQMTRNAEGFAQVGQGRSEATDAVMTAFYVTNNVRVSFVAFALGITFGLGTMWVLIQNGFVLGVTMALVRHYGSLGRLPRLRLLARPDRDVRDPAGRRRRAGPGPRPRAPPARTPGPSPSSWPRARPPGW